MLDIDAKSKYHNKQSLHKLLKVLADARLARQSLYRSSHSGGWHLYLFFDEPVDSVQLRSQLIRLLTVHNFQIEKGILEIFPHRSKDSNGRGMGLRLPLQPGWAWIDKQTLEIQHERDNISATAALELFIDSLDGDANSIKDFERLGAHIEQLASRKAVIHRQIKAPSNNVVPFKKNPSNNASTGQFTDFVLSIFQELPPGIIVDNWYKGRIFHINGLTRESQRAEAIICIGHYLFYGDPSRNYPALGYGYEQERKWAIEEILSSRHNGHSKDINRGRSDAFSQIERAVNWRPANKRSAEPAKYSMQQPISWVRENANRQIAARKRIKSALDNIVEKKQPFTKKELQSQSKCSWTTLYKHRDIWNQAYEDLAKDFFAISTYEYNAVEGAAKPLVAAPSAFPKKDMPPERLAARRLVYEWAMRSKREENRKQKTVLKANKDAEIDWRNRVTALTAESPENLPIKTLKSLIPVLSHYLSIAPNWDDQNQLSKYIQCLRETYTSRMLGPQPPPE